MAISKKSSPDETLTPTQYKILEEENLITEEQALQQEIITEIPGFIRLLMKYELKPLIKIAGGVILIVSIWMIFGWDAVAGAVVSFIFLFALTYYIQIKHQHKDAMLFLEMKLPGQKITTGDHSPYSQTFFTTEKRLAVWSVPNALIRKGLFTIPNDQGKTLMPGSGEIMFVDMFDRINRTCVLPRDMDVANIALPTNANPLVAEKLAKVAEQIKLDKGTEKLITELWHKKEISAKDAQRLLTPIKIRNAAFLNPTTETRRDIFFELQRVIPELREKYQDISNRIFLLADAMAARGIYQLVNRPMPEHVRKDHELLGKLLGLPTDELDKKILGIEEDY